MLTRDVWDLSERDFPRAGPIDLQLRFLLRYAILAPSVKNTQPWSFTVASNRVHLAAARNRDLPVADPHQRELYISLGCALEISWSRRSISGSVTRSRTSRHPKTIGWSQPSLFPLGGQ